MFNPGPSERCRCPGRWPDVLCVALLLLAMVPGDAAFALPDDKDQPMRITADTAMRDEKEGVTIYSGNVNMVQGSLKIGADKLTIYHETEQADKIVAEGKPATMQQKPEVDEPLVKARAEIIEYYKSEERLHFRINAHIDQDGTTVTGNTIDYLIEEQLVTADSDQAQQGNRVEVVIPPQTIREEKDASGTTDSE
jgi:lipopolysaccharide export system protein LptA